MISKLWMENSLNPFGNYSECNYDTISAFLFSTGKALIYFHSLKIRMNSSCSVWKSTARPASSPFGLHSDRSLFSGWVQPMSAEQTGQAWTVSQSMRSVSPLSTYLSSHFNKTRAAAASSPHCPNHSLIILTRWPLQCKVLPLELTPWHPDALIWSWNADILDVCHHRYQWPQSREGGGADVYSCAAAAASCSQWKRRNDSDVK